MAEPFDRTAREIADSFPELTEERRHELAAAIEKAIEDAYWATVAEYKMD